MGILAMKAAIREGKVTGLSLHTFPLETMLPRNTESKSEQMLYIKINETWN